MYEMYKERLLYLYSAVIIKASVGMGRQTEVLMRRLKAGGMPTVACTIT